MACEERLCMDEKSICMMQEALKECWKMDLLYNRRSKAA